jgi:hypothetical protein
MPKLIETAATRVSRENRRLWVVVRFFIGNPRVPTSYPGKGRGQASSPARFGQCRFLEASTERKDGLKSPGRGRLENQRLS